MATTVHSQRHSSTGTAYGAFAAPGLVMVEVLLLALVALLALAVHVHKGPLPGDVDGLLAVQHLFWGRGAVTTGIDDVSNLSWPLPAAITVAAVTGLLLLLRQWLSALIAPLLVAAADGSNYLISQAVERTRPSGHGIHVAANIKNFYGFPSGHVLYAVVFFGFLIFLILEARRRIPWLMAGAVRLAALVVLMPISRLLQGEHWPSDVLAGGSGGCSGCWQLYTSIAGCGIVCPRCAGTAGAGIWFGLRMNPDGRKRPDKSGWSIPMAMVGLFCQSSYAGTAGAGIATIDE
jgi:membrane-associated phospholipid phosphatase